MALKTTSLQGILKKKLSNEIKVPTIWIDMSGKFHEDWTNTAISSTVYWPGNNDEHDSTFSDFLVCNGFIQQVGSHVTSCGHLSHFASLYPFDLSKTFAYAKNLKELSGLFLLYNDLIDPFEIPEDLLWGCPNLKIVDGAFKDSNITSIPSRLFEKCPNLETIKEAFLWCKNLTNVPFDLFKNNKRIYSLKDTFSGSGIVDVPKPLLEPLIAEDSRGFYHLDVERAFYKTPFSKNVVKVDQKLTLPDRIDHLKMIRTRSFPDNVKLSDIDKMTSEDPDFRLNDPYRCSEDLAKMKR